MPSRTPRPCHRVRRARATACASRQRKGRRGAREPAWRHLRRAARRRAARIARLLLPRRERIVQLQALSFDMRNRLTRRSAPRGCARHYMPKKPAPAALRSTIICQNKCSTSLRLQRIRTVTPRPAVLLQLFVILGNVCVFVSPCAPRRSPEKALTARWLSLIDAIRSGTTSAFLLLRIPSTRLPSRNHSSVNWATHAGSAEPSRDAPQAA